MILNKMSIDGLGKHNSKLKLLTEFDTYYSQLRQFGFAKNQFPILHCAVPVKFPTSKNDKRQFNSKMLKMRSHMFDSLEIRTLNF